MNKETIERYVEEAYRALATAEAIADGLREPFNFEPSYGMGGTYFPPSYFEGREWFAREYGIDPSEGGWISSTARC